MKYGTFRYDTVEMENGLYRWRFKQLPIGPCLINDLPTHLLTKLTLSTFPVGETEVPGENHDFRQSVGLYSFHMRTGFEPH